MSIINVIVLGLPILICISGVISKPKSWYDGAARRPHFDPFSGQRNVWYERDALDRLDDEYNAERVARKLTYEDDFERAFDALLQKEEESQKVADPAPGSTYYMDRNVAPMEKGSLYYRDQMFDSYAVDGGYTSWSTWSECSRTCGEGERVRQRSCQNPTPSNGGSNCDKLGPSVEKQKCLLPSCSDGQRENLQLIVASTSPSTTTYVENLINAIPERKYRLALMVNSAPVYEFLKFTEKQCAVNKMKNITKSKGNGNEDSLCLCRALDKLNHSVPFSNVLIITDRTLRDHERNCAVRYGKEHGLNMYIIEYHRSAKTHKVYWIREEMYLLEERDLALPFFEERLMECREDGRLYHYDECGRRCLCIIGRLTNCYRVRQEFSKLSLDERLHYINVYKTASMIDPFKREFDNYVDKHHQVFAQGTHTFLQFLPWHRRYLLGFENLLRQVDCRVTVPMWNWALHSEYAWETRPNYHMWDNFGGFGGNGSAPDFCVKYGHFAKGIWLTSGREDSAYIEKYTELQLEEYITSDQGKLSNNRTKYLNREALRVRSEHNRVDGHINPWTRSASHNCLRRAFTCLPPSLKRVTDYILCLEPSEIKIVSAFNSLWHNKVHECLLGHMATEYSSHTPEFFLHHAMLDSLWDNWQRQGPASAFKDKSVYPVPLVGFPGEVGESMVDNDALCDCISVSYPYILGEKTMSNGHQKMPQTLGYEIEHFKDQKHFEGFTNKSLTRAKRRCENN